MIGVYPTCGMWDDKPDGLMRLQPGYADQRLSHVSTQASWCLADTRRLFQDRVRRPFGGEKGGEKGKGKGVKRKGGKDKGKGGRPGPKAPNVQRNPLQMQRSARPRRCGYLPLFLFVC